MTRLNLNPAAVAAVLLLAVATVLPAGDRIVAAVDQRVITERDLDFWALEARLHDSMLWEVPNEDLRPRFVGRAIDEILLADWAELQNEEIPVPLLRQRTREWNDRLRELAGGALRLNNLLEDMELEPEELTAWIEKRARRKLHIEQAIAARLPIGSEDAMEGAARDAAVMRLGHLIVRVGVDQEAAYERALEIRRDIAAGLSFANAVRLYSEDPAARRTGGDLGWLTHDEMAKPLWDAAMTLRRGEVTLPVLWRGAYHLIQLIDYETERQRAFFEALQREELARLREQREVRRIRLTEGYTLPPLPEQPPPVTPRGNLP